MVWGGDAPETDSAARLAPDGTRRDAADAPLEQGVAPASDDPTRGSSFVRLPGLIGRSLRFVWEAGRRELLVILVLEVLSGVALFAQLLLGRSIISTLIQDGEGGFRLSGLVPELLGLGAATVFGAFAASALSEGQRVLTELVTRHTSDRLIDVTTQVDLEAFDNPDFYDRLERSRSNAAQRMYELASGVIALGAGLTGLAALTAVLFSVGLPFLPLVVLAYVPLWLATARNGRSSYAFTFWATPADREREYLENVLTGKPEAKEVRLFGLAPLFRQRYSRLYDMRMAELRRVTKLRLRRSLLANVVSTTITLAAAVYLIQLSADGRIRTADAGVAVIATVQMGTRLRALGRGAGSIGECSLFLADFESFVRVKDSAIRQPPDQTIVPAFDSVVAERVTFVYPGTDKHVLRDVTLHLGCGEMIAVVGRNGSGKSTLAKLLCGLYRPTAGRVLMNGADVSSLPPDALRAASAAIFQDFVCYQLSARDNVGVGDTRAFDDHARIRRAAADAGIDETLAGLADGYATVLSRAFAGGAELSIGQWQRVALARAFFRDAPLVILDEPAAALDAEAEQELFAYIRRLRQGRAALVISHRMSTIRDADRIYVLDQGRVVETGTHEELVEAKGHYAELFNLQAAAYAREPESH